MFCSTDYLCIYLRMWKLDTCEKSRVSSTVVSRGFSGQRRDANARSGKIGLRVSASGLGRVSLSETLMVLHSRCFHSDRYHNTRCLCTSITGDMFELTASAENAL